MCSASKSSNKCDNGDGTGTALALRLAGKNALLLILAILKFPIMITWVRIRPIVTMAITPVIWIVRSATMMIFFPDDAPGGCQYCEQTYQINDQFHKFSR